MALAVVALTLTSCGSGSKSANADTDTTSMESVDSLTQDGVAATEVPNTAETAIAQLTEQLDSKDAAKVKTTLETIKEKIAELSKTDPDAAKAYVEQLQSWLKSNSDKVKTAVGEDTAVSAAIETLTSASSDKLIEGYTKAKDVIESATGTATGEAAKAAATAKEVKEAYEKVKEVTPEKVQEKVNEKAKEAKEAGKAKAREEAAKAVDKGLKSLGL